MTQPQEPSLGEKIKARRAAVQNEAVRVYVEQQLAAAKEELVQQVVAVQETVIAVQDQVAAVQEGVQVLNTPVKGQLA